MMNLSIPFLLRQSFGALLIAALAGCASFSGLKPQSKLTTPEALGAAGSITYPADDWWTAYNDPKLNELIAAAVAGSPTMRTAQARLERAQSTIDVSRSALSPQLAADASSSRQRFSENFIYPPPFGGSWYTQNDARLNGSWELDLFGRNRAALDASIGTAHAAEADREAARVLLAARVASAYFNLAQTLEQRKVAEATLQDRMALEKLVAQRVGAGLDTNVELRQAQGNVPQTRQEIATLDEQIGIARHALAALAGAGPQAYDALTPGITERPALQLPATVPADLLGRRADIVAARWRVEAASRDIAVAKAEFYPDINLSAFIGFQSLGFTNWLSSASRVIGIGPAVHLPIFEGGKLRGNLRGKDADYDIAVEDYNAKLIDALRDVADQLTSTHSVETQWREQQDALAAAQSAYDLAQQRYRAGLSTYLTVLTAELNLEQQRKGAVGLKARRYALDVELARALGGGFHADAPAAQKTSSIK
ncbi:MAG: putative outer membrane protein [Betaproteobacteria bacterium]|nr:putative outer membrane protein [Betaproteobacteria bacterium]